MDGQLAAKLATKLFARAGLKVRNQWNAPYWRCQRRPAAWFEHARGHFFNMESTADRFTGAPGSQRHGGRSAICLDSRSKWVSSTLFELQVNGDVAASAPEKLAAACGLRL